MYLLVFSFCLKIANWKQNVMRTVLAAGFGAAVCLFKSKWYKWVRLWCSLVFYGTACVLTMCNLIFVVRNDTCEECKESDNKQTAPSVAWLCWRRHLWFITPSHCLWPSQGISVQQAYGFCEPLEWQWFCLLVKGCMISCQEQATECC